jgi:BMFP domain-containing protein YqiC
MQTNNRVFDDLAALLTSAVGAAKGARDEVALLLRQQGERIAGDLALASREEVEVVKDLARQALARLEALDERLDAIEARLERLEPRAQADRPQAEDAPGTE